MQISDRINLLLITPNTFHESVMHAGGKSIDFYFSQYCNDTNFNTAIIYLGNYDIDVGKMQKKYDESLVIFDAEEKSILSRLRDYLCFNYLYGVLKKTIPYYYITNGFIKRKIVKLIDLIPGEFKPDVIIIEYTSAILFVDVVRKKFPNAKIIASCHDVIFQSIERKLEHSNLFLFNKWFINGIKKIEKQALIGFDLITVPSIKDEILIERNLGISANKMQVITLFYDNYTIDEQQIKDGILFFGFMGREENFLSVFWFLEHVWIKIKAIIPDLMFYIVGGGLNSTQITQIKRYKDVVIAGYVADPSVYFSRSLAMVAPLQIGAGVKVKSLETMASGLPLITNTIGIEGIDAIPDIHYLHSEDAEQWVNSIKKIYYNLELRMFLANNAQRLIADVYSPLNSFNALKNRIYKL